MEFEQIVQRCCRDVLPHAAQLVPVSGMEEKTGQAQQQHGSIVPRTIAVQGAKLRKGVNHLVNSFFALIHKNANHKMVSVFSFHTAMQLSHPPLSLLATLVASSP